MSETPIQIDTGRSAMVVVEYTRRKMKFYNVTEDEVDSLSLLNTQQSGFLGTATLLIGIALPDLYSAIFPLDGVTASADWRKISFFTIPAAVCFAASWLLKRQSRRLWAKIGSQTIPDSHR